MVRAKGLEPPHLAILVPKTSASTNSATPARTLRCAAYNRAGPLGNPSALQLTAQSARSAREESLSNATGTAARSPYSAARTDPAEHPAADASTGRGAGHYTKH